MKNDNGTSFGRNAQNPRASGAELLPDHLEMLSRYVHSHVDLVPPEDHAARTLIGNIAVTIRRCPTGAELGRYVRVLRQLHDALKDAPETLRKAAAQAACS